MGIGSKGNLELVPDWLQKKEMLPISTGTENILIYL